MKQKTKQNNNNFILNKNTLNIIIKKNYTTQSLKFLLLFYSPFILMTTFKEYKVVLVGESGKL